MPIFPLDPDTYDLPEMLFALIFRYSYCTFNKSYNFLRKISITTCMTSILDLVVINHVNNLLELLHYLGKIFQYISHSYSNYELSIRYSNHNASMVMVSFSCIYLYNLQHNLQLFTINSKLHKKFLLLVNHTRIWLVGTT